jgi:GTP-binding protein
MNITLTTFVKSCTRIEDVPPGGRPQIAFVGRSNVGKSSLINTLAQKKDLSRVSASPGRTRFLNIFDVNHDFLLVDLPGYGYAKTSKKERERYEQLIYEYLTKTQHLRLVFLVVDAQVGLTDLDIEMVDFLQASHLHFILIANKIDKLSRTETNALFQHLAASLPQRLIIGHSSKTGVGRKDMLQAMEQALKNV